MQFPDRPELGHLTYCTNIHAGEHWPDVLESLKRHLPDIKAAVSPDQPMGVGLRLSASAAQALQDPATFAELRALLDTGGYYVFTINGFPYGAFHGETVKENVYRPDWSEPERLDYTNTLADLLIDLLPDGQTGSISTVPCTFKGWSNVSIDKIADNLIVHVAHLVSLHKNSGKTIVLTLEPEPCCYLETIEETIAFFQSYLFSAKAEQHLAEITGMDRAQAAAALRRHLGVCYDVCHAAVEFEDPGASISALRDAGIAITKVQLSSALKISAVGRQTPEQLQPFVEPVYLHQVVERKNGTLTRHRDLPSAFADGDNALDAEWRIHFHVPVFLKELKDFGTTQDFLREILAIHRETPIGPHLEVETYTWDVLPPEYKTDGLAAAIARELTWVREQLGA